jgi:hypothetical protein
MPVLTGNQIGMYRLLVLRSGLALEAKGMKMSRGLSAMSILKKEFGFKGNRQKIAAQLQALIDSQNVLDGKGSDTLLI